MKRKSGYTKVKVGSYEGHADDAPSERRKTGRGAYIELVFIPVPQEDPRVQK